MSAVPTTPSLHASRRRVGDHLGDLGLRSLTLAAALGALVLLGAIVFKVLDLAHPAWSKYGISFLRGRTWDPVHELFGALPFIYGTAMSSLIALLIATPLGIAIGLYLSELAPRGVRGV